LSKNISIMNFKNNFHSLKIVLVLLLAISSISCDDDNDLSLQTLLEQHNAKLKSVLVGTDNMSYLEYGSGDNTLILLHGIPTSSFLYREVAPKIAEQSDFRVIAVDMLGYGQSDKPVREGAYSPEAQAARIYDFATALGIDEFILGLHDVGGLVGWAMFLQEDLNRVKGVIVANASPAFVDMDGQLAGVTPAPLTLEILTGQKTPREQWSQLDDPDFARMATNEFLEIGFLDDAKITEELLDAYTNPIENGASENFIQFCETFGGVFAQGVTLQSVFNDFDKPVFIVWGKEDEFFDVDIVPVNLQTQLNVPDERFIIIEDAGHYVQEEKADEYATAVSNFLNDEF